MQDQDARDDVDGAARPEGQRAALVRHRIVLELLDFAGHRARILPRASATELVVWMTMW